MSDDYKVTYNQDKDAAKNVQNSFQNNNSGFKNFLKKIGIGGGSQASADTPMDEAIKNRQNKNSGSYGGDGY